MCGGREKAHLVTTYSVSVESPSSTSRASPKSASFMVQSAFSSTFWPCAEPEEEEEDHHKEGERKGRLTSIPPCLQVSMKHVGFVDSQNAEKELVRKILQGLLIVRAASQIHHNMKQQHETTTT